ncbi:MAG: SPW repeat protein, partial [Pontibacter sp.]|nr:SPW repeat protein [Pontibacter sp.]
MGLSFGNLFFVHKGMFPEEKQKTHEEHHRRTSWVYYGIMVLGLWLLASPPTFNYTVPAMIWSNIVTGFVLLFLSYFAMKPYKLWAQWALVFVGIWLFIAPMIFWAKEEAAMLNDYIVGTLVV